MSERERVADLCERLEHHDFCSCDPTLCRSAATNLKRLAARCDALEEAARAWLKYNDADMADIVMMLDYSNALALTRAALGSDPA